MNKVDQLGALNSQIAKLEGEAKKIKESLIKDGNEVVMGEFYYAKITVQFRENLDMTAVRAHLSPQFITAHTNVNQITSVRVSLRKDVCVQAA